MSRLFEPCQLEPAHQQRLDQFLERVNIDGAQRMLSVNAQAIAQQDNADVNYSLGVWNFRYARELEMRRLEAELGLAFDHRKPGFTWLEQRSVSELRAQMDTLEQPMHYWLDESCADVATANRAINRDKKSYTPQTNLYLAVRSMFACAREIERKEKVDGENIPD